MFKNYINEMSIAKRGNWSNGSNFVGNFRIEKLEKYIKVAEIDTFFVYQLNNSLEFIVGAPEKTLIQTKMGEEYKDTFKVIFNIHLVREKLLDKLGYTKMVRVSGVSTHEDYQQAGIATFMYKFIVNELGYSIIGDREQYFGARKLWVRLSNDINISVDLVDIFNKDIIEKNIILHHGKYDEDFDSRSWSYEDDKANIRPVLVNIF